MKILLSSSKTQDFTSDILPAQERIMGQLTQPEFLIQTNEVIKKWQKKSQKQIQKEMKLSDTLATKTFKQFKDFEIIKKYSTQQLQITEQFRPALTAYTGTVFKSIEWQAFTKEQFKYAQNSLHIMSGLYGLLRPLNMIQPYRLEMKFEYTFWREILTEQLQKEKRQIINLASSESTAALNIKELENNFYTIDFKEQKGDDYKTVAVYAKQARGLFANWMIQNKIQKISDLKKFDLENYTFNEELSSQFNLVFTR